jgi:hypothetical protein
MGSNDLSAIFSGVIDDNGFSGSLTKIGNRTLARHVQANLYERLIGRQAGAYLLLPVLMPDCTQDFFNLSGDVCNPRSAKLGALGRFG